MKFNSDTGKQAGKNSTRAGKPNKTTKELKEMVQILFENNLENLQKDLEALEPKDRITAMLSLANYVLPKMKGIELSGNSDSDNFRPIVVRLR